MGFVDGQTTNPSLISKNPAIQAQVASGHKLSLEEQTQEYKKIVQTISPLVGDAGVSIEVFSDLKTSAEQMFAQGQDMFTWIPNAYIKYPCTAICGNIRSASKAFSQSAETGSTQCALVGLVHHRPKSAVGRKPTWRRWTITAGIRPWMNSN
jgi:transaldolase